ncbi:MAG: CrcB family protein [Bacillus sp. (in: Bacteria)]|nr:CrcB family protein [Bacillus sp. (in: firmicutes)]
MSDLIFVSIGGFFGAICRFAVSKFVQSLKKTSFPIGTLAVNLTGAFLLGLLVGMHVVGDYYTLLGIGFMGAFTTFSTMMLELDQLKMAGESKTYYLYLASSYTIGIILIYFGLVIGRIT